MRLCNECKQDYARTNDGLCISCNEGLIEDMCCENIELRDALEGLLNEQNGPPLLRRELQWNEAVLIAEKVLGRDKK